MSEVPVLMYHVIAPPPAGAPYPGLYVDPDQFAAEMQGLKAAGWRPVTLDQLRAYWTRGVPLPPGKPLVLTFDNGYRSQYTNALPILQKLGWVADENIQLTGLPVSQGGLTEAQVRSMIAAGVVSWLLQIRQRDAGPLRRGRVGVASTWVCGDSPLRKRDDLRLCRPPGFRDSAQLIAKCTLALVIPT